MFLTLGTSEGDMGGDRSGEPVSLLSLPTKGSDLRLADFVEAGVPLTLTSTVSGLLL